MPTVERVTGKKGSPFPTERWVRHNRGMMAAQQASERVRSLDPERWREIDEVSALVEKYGLHIYSPKGHSPETVERFNRELAELRRRQARRRSR